MIKIELPLHPENQVAMARYMQDQFKFNGVKAPERHLLERDIWSAVKHYSATEMLALIRQLYAQEAREYQYLAIDLAVRAKRIWQLADLQDLLAVVTDKAWWDTIDIWRKLYSEYIKLHPEQFDVIWAFFAGNDNFWLRRISLILQLGFKNQTRLMHLTQAIEADQATDEFFIQKAIGWALREYAKTDADWVRQFVATHQLASLAQKEALKQIK